MSPLLLRRYRAERLLRQEFDALRERVLGVVRTRLRTRGVQLDDADLEACYAQAWQGLYATVLEGARIDSPAGWLVLVTFRRAIDEHRSRLHEDDAPLAPETPAGQGASQRDLAQEIDDRDRLRHVFEGLRGRLNARECQAASLCYLQGLSRSQAAAQLGISEARMRKLMEGDAGKGPGVAGKVGEVLDAIRGERWCEQQSSLMRALAFGILDPEGERFRLAQLHRRECPACRAYVLSLRGLASVLPPVALPWGLGLGALVGGAGAGAGSGAGVGAASGGGGAAGAGAAGGTGGSAVGALSASGAAGVGAGAGGGWLLAGGSVGAKLAVGCLMALGFGAGCVALTDGHAHDSRRPRHEPVAGSAGARRALAEASQSTSTSGAALGHGIADASAVAASSARTGAAGTRATAPKAQREFGLEQPSAASSAPGASTPGGLAGGSVAGAASGARASSVSSSRAATHPPALSDAGAAQREFGAG
jgi:DNA-directed RNA polymerase specialized sigma24 family protein